MTSRQRSRTAGGGPDLRVIAVVVGVLALLVLTAVIVVTNGDDENAADEPAGPEFGAVEVRGDVLPPLGDLPDSAVGQEAPRLLGERPGLTTIVDPADGEPTMLVFLAHWCPHCQRELPRLVELADAGEFDDIRTVAVLIATDPDRPNYPPSAWLDAEGWLGDRLYDDVQGSAAVAYGVTSFPFIVFLDADGAVSSRLSGEQPAAAIQAAVGAISP